MTDISDRYARLSDAFAAKVAAVPADGWDRPTPCEDWTVRDLVRHVIETPATFFGLVGREMQPVPAVDDDPVAAFSANRDQVLADLRDPERAGTGFDGFSGRSTFAEAVDRFVSFDLTVHGWDLARATGQDESIDPGDVDRGWQSVEVFGDAIRSEGTCGTAVEPPPDADEQTRLLSYLGRRV